MGESIVFILLILSGLVMVLSGGWFLLEIFVLFRKQMTNSLNTNLDIIKVVKSKKPEGQDAERKNQAEKEEIAVMEHLLTTLSDIQIKKGLLHNIFYGKPQLAFEVAVPSDGDQITFYIAIPNKLRELVEKQIHSFFPSAYIERVKDYTIFRPKSFTAGSYLKLKKNHAFPIRTYQRLESDPLSNITNALSKMESEQEGAAFQFIIRRSAKSSGKGKSIAQQMQQGKRLEKVSNSNVLGTVAKDVGKGMFDVMSKNKTIKILPKMTVKTDQSTLRLRKMT